MRQPLSSGSKPDRNVDIDSLVAQVRDLLPDLGEGFVELCLEYFDNLPEKVINAILEDNLPPHLSSVERSLARKSTTPKNSEAVSTSTDNFDGEFDEETNYNIDLSRVQKGKKKRGAKDANALLNDKKDLSGKNFL